MPKESIVQPRLEADVAEMVKQSAEDNVRSIPGEVNFALRQFYRPTIPRTPILSALTIASRQAVKTKRR